jgi:transketolase
MGRGEPPKQYPVPAYAPWRQLTQGNGPLVIAVGPLAGTYIEAFNQEPIQTRPNLWAVCELPISTFRPPQALLDQLANNTALCVAEEHVKHGGFASDLLLFLAQEKIYPKNFEHLYARAHHYERYGSQGFLRKQSNLDPESMMATIGKMRNG